MGDSNEDVERGIGIMMFLDIGLQINQAATRDPCQSVIKLPCKPTSTSELRCFRLSLYGPMAHLQQLEDQNSESSKTVIITHSEHFEFKPHSR